MKNIYKFTIIALLVIGMLTFVVANDYSTSNLGNIYVRGNSTFNESIVGDGDNVKIGSGSDSHSLTSPNDVYIAGKLEVDGQSYFDGNAYFTQNIDLALGKSFNFVSATYGKIHTSADDGLMIGVGTSEFGNRNLIITDQANTGKDHDHDTFSDDPTIFLHANEDPDTDNTKWGSLAYSNFSDVFNIDTGEGSAGTKVMANFTSHQDTHLEGDVYIGQQEGQDLLSIEGNGTDIVFDSVLEQNFHFSGGNITFDNGASIVLNATCITLVSPAGEELSSCDP